MNEIKCPFPDNNPPEKEIRELLKTTKRIAIVGLSPKEERDSNKVARYLMAKGYEVVPVNPGQSEILGQRCFKTLRDIPFQVDVADLFLNPARVMPVVDDAIDKGVGVIWMQLGIVHNEAAAKARAAGITVVMDKCMKQEHEKLKS